MEIAKQVTLVSNNSWMLGMKIYGVGKGLVRISKVND